MYINTLLNKYEEIVFGRLKFISEANDAHVFAKVRVADVLPLDKSGVSNDLFGYGLKSHFDFTITSSTYNPLFAVEFDGPLHQQSKTQMQRDEKKNLLAKNFGFPLLRINSRYINRIYRGLDLLTYFIEVWFLSEAFDKAQAEGQIPCDESFDSMSIINDGKSKKRFPYWLSIDIQAELKKLKESGLIKDNLLSHWVGIDTRGNHRCLTWLNVADDRVLLARTGMRYQNFPVDISDVLPQVSAFDIRYDVDVYLKGLGKGMRVTYLEKVLDDCKKRYKMCCFCGHTKYNKECT